MIILTMVRMTLVKSKRTRWVERNGIALTSRVVLSQWRAKQKAVKTGRKEAE